MNENAIEGRNVVIEAFRGGKTVDKLEDEHDQNFKKELQISDKEYVFSARQIGRAHV